MQLVPLTSLSWRDIVVAWAGGGIWKDIVNVVTLHQLPVSSCNFFELLNVLKVRLPYEQDNSTGIACIML